MMQEYPSLVWHLKNTQLFEDLSEEELEGLSRITPYKRFKAGEVIYRMEDSADALYFIREGMVKISMYFPNGKEMILALFGKYDAFGELLLLPSERRPNQAEAVMDLIGSEDKEFFVLDAGHVGLMTGRGAKKGLWPKVSAWLSERSDKL